MKTYVAILGFDLFVFTKAAQGEDVQVVKNAKILYLSKYSLLVTMNLLHFAELCRTPRCQAQVIPVLLVS